MSYKPHFGFYRGSNALEALRAPPVLNGCFRAQRVCVRAAASELGGRLRNTQVWLQKSEERSKKFEISSLSLDNKMGYTYGTEICQKLGAGAFGVVYKMDNPRGAPYSRKHPIVAVKVIAVSESFYVCANYVYVLLQIMLC